MSKLFQIASIILLSNQAFAGILGSLENCESQIIAKSIETVENSAIFQSRIDKIDIKKDAVYASDANSNGGAFDVIVQMEDRSYKTGTIYYYTYVKGESCKNFTVIDAQMFHNGQSIGSLHDKK